MSKEKRILEVSGVAHAWAHQRNTNNTEAYYDAANAGKNYYYSGKSIYSYGKHFEIARIIQDNPTVVLFTTRTYSNTTAGHISTTRAAIPDYWNVFNVPVFHDMKPLKDEVRHNVEHYTHLIEKAIDKQSRARTADYTRDIKKYIAEIRKYVEFFKGEKYVPKYYKFLLAPDLDITDLAKLSEGFGLVGKSKFKEAKAQERKLKEKQKKRIADWLSGETAYKSDIISLVDEVKLRVYKYPKNTELPDTIQTSKGIEISLEDGNKLWRAIGIARERKVSLPKDGEPISVGGWDINRIDEGGNITAGCHKVKFAEAERIAKELGWV